MPKPRQLFTWYEYKINGQKSLLSLMIYDRFRNEPIPKPAVGDVYYALYLRRGSYPLQFQVHCFTWNNDYQNSCHKNASNIFTKKEDAEFVAANMKKEFDIACDGQTISQLSNIDSKIHEIAQEFRETLMKLRSNIKYDHKNICS